MTQNNKKEGIKGQSAKCKVQSERGQSAWVLPENEQKIIKLLYQNQEGLRANTLRKLTNIKQRTLYKTLNKLRDKEFLKNIFPIWKLTKEALCTIQGGSEIWAKSLNGENIFELHDLSFVVKLINKPDWWAKRENRLINLKEYQFKNVEWGNNPYIQLLNENFVIQVYSSSIIVMNRKRYHATNPYDCILKGLTDFINLWKWFEEKYRFKFFSDGVPQVTIRSQHYVRIGDVLASKCKKEGEKFFVEVNHDRIWVDFSAPLGSEGNNPGEMEKYEALIEDRMKKPSLLPSEMTEALSQTQEQIQLMVTNVSNFTKESENYALHIKSHIKAIQQLGDGVENQNKIMSELLQAVKELRK